MLARSLIRGFALARWSELALAGVLATACAGTAQRVNATPEPPTASAMSEADDASAASRGARAAGAPATTLSTFAADFSQPEIGPPLNVFGAQQGNRVATGGPSGLSLAIRSAQKAWDAVSVRTAHVTVDGDFDVRGAYRGFAGDGNVATKLLVVDAASPRGEAAYVERVRIDAKDWYKFGGEIDGSLENWGFAEAAGNAGELRLVRRGGVLQAYQRVAADAAWTAFVPPQPVPKGMPRVVKVGVKLSAEAGHAAAVTWASLAVDGKIARVR